ncbi:MAG: DUF3800 domain-containing protein [[Actinobacillus] rossii]|nr:DUF3800 domain-containing protein [[Actinobacillus] rossii]MDY3123055.1 DUF3800 domain-containing protein [[Actinobacillus] rossii]
MFFYIDESGNTGLNLTDESQPYLYYGVLSSSVDLDNNIPPEILEIKKILSVDRLHANELGVAKLSRIAHLLEDVIKKYELKFDLYKLVKKDYMIISFFDQIFDQGMNPVVPWHCYWTPLRFPLLFNVANLFDDELIQKSWQARIEHIQTKSEQLLIEVCNKLVQRIRSLPDERTREIIRNTLTWVIHNPSKIYYNGPNTKESRLQISPNLICFQNVLFGILYRSQIENLPIDKIIVDQQFQFNNAQKWIIELYQKTNDILWIGPGLPKIDLRNMYQTPLSCTSSNNSIGLELVDIVQWLFKRFFENKSLSNELFHILNILADRGLTNEISLSALSECWSKWFNELPDLSEYSEEHLRKVRERRVNEDQQIRNIIAQL